MRTLFDIDSIDIFSKMHTELSYCADQLNAKDGGSVRRALINGGAAINRIKQASKSNQCGYRIERRYDNIDGHIWIEVISDCGENFEFENNKYMYFDFCPYCGRPMKKGSKS